MDPQGNFPARKVLPSTADGSTRWQDWDQENEEGKEKDISFNKYLQLLLKCSETIKNKFP